MESNISTSSKKIKGMMSTLVLENGILQDFTLKGELDAREGN
jgi:hypothetical protein